MKLKSREELALLREECKGKNAKEKYKILVCNGTGCLANGAINVYEKFAELCSNPSEQVELTENIDHSEIAVKKSGCQGCCELGPLVKIEPWGYLYLKVSPDDCEEIFKETILNGRPVERLLFHDGDKVYKTQNENPFYAKQTKNVLENCGNTAVEDIKEMIAAGAYEALVKALFEMTPEDVVKTVIDSKLRGRGGAGFPAGEKWRQVAAQGDPVKYIVCNGDEGDPGAFMDQVVMEGDPHRMIEGMIIAGYGAGAHEGYIYVRAEYPLAIKRLKIAIAQAEELGLLGENILGSGFDFNLHINRGAGAFVCGEGTALMASIEGQRGMPRVKPPRTTEKGLWGKPTVLNNVETFANVSMIINNGSEWYRSIGTETTPGTKCFALTGNIKYTGLIEVPMGITLREVIFDIGGGIKNNKKFKAVQIGGPSGGCLTESQLDVPVDFDELKRIGAMMGSGGLVVMDEDTCMVEVARFFMNFTQRESCGKCVPCREGTKRMLEVLERIIDGRGEPTDIELLRQLADLIKNTALCGLGQSAPNPVISTLNAFEDEYKEHILQRHCKTKVCPKLKKYIIDPSKCRGCSVCARNCPAEAITGVIKSPFVIDETKCIKCGTCIDNCTFHAVYAE